jgi:hypothetical protein
MPTATLIAQKLNESPADLVARVDAFLVAAGAIGLQQVLVTRRSDAPGPRFTLSIVYTTPGPLSMRAASFIGTPTNPADTQANAFFAAHTGYRAHVLRDLGDQRRGALGIDALMAIYAESTVPNCGYDRSRMILVKATQIIAAGASGTASRVFNGGTGTAVTIYNRSTISWAIGVSGYAFPRAGDCLYDAIPTCCGP